MTSSEKCRANGWTVGTVLEGVYSAYTSRIVITAIGENEILAKRIMHNERPLTDSKESQWFLDYRDWKEVKP